MTAPTRNVTVKLFDAHGNACPDGTTVTARLDQTDVYQGFVVPTVFEAETTDGIAVVPCFPNHPTTGLGTTGSKYTFYAAPSGWQPWRVEEVQVPDQDCDLDTIANLTPAPALSTAEAAQAAAVQAAAAATTKAAEAAASAEATEADVQQTTQDRAQTELDRVATGEDRVQTGLDRVAVETIAGQLGDLQAAVAGAEEDALATAADRVQTGLDAAAAAAAQAAAETALAGVMAAGNVFADTTAGLAASASGDYFAVPSADARYLSLYLDNAGVAELKFQWYSKTGFDAKLSPITTAIRGMALDANGNAAFTTLAAFFGGVQGDAFVCDLSKMWQDTAMTTPVTAAGDPIAAWESVTGAYVALQATSGSRPALAQDADGNYYVDFATSKWMSVASFNLSGSNRLTLVAALNKVASTVGLMCELSANVTLNNGTFFYQTRAGATTDTVAIKGTGSTQSIVSVTGGEPQKFIATVQIDLGAPERVTAVKIRKNGVDLTTSGGAAPGDVNFTSSQALYIGSRAGSSQYFNNHLYALAIVGGSAKTSTIKRLEHDFSERSGLTVNSTIAVPAIPPAAKPNYHVVGMGQSLGNGTLSTPLRNTVARYSNVYSFAGGVRPRDSSSDVGDAYSSYIAMIERTAGSNSLAAYNASTVNETPMSGLCAAWNQLLTARAATLAFSKLIGSVSGFGATSLFKLGRGMPAYDRGIEEIRYGRRLSERENRPHIVPAVTWMQGVADTGNTSTYEPGLKDLYADLCEDVKDASGQTFNPILLCSQTAGHHSVAVQQLAAMDTTGIYVAFPEYFLTRVDGIGHLSGLGSELAGAYFAKALDEVLPTAQGGKGNTSWVPLSPLSFSYAGGDIDITFQGNVGNVALDTTTVAAQTASGFSITDAGAANVPITSVTVTGANTIRLSTAATITAGFTVKYATALAGGNVRDSDTATYTSAQDGVKNLYNWLCAFQEVMV